MAGGKVKADVAPAAEIPAPVEQGPETHAQRCKRELQEQEVILAKVREDSERYEDEMARRRSASEAEGAE